VPRGDIQAFADALLELASNAALRLEMGVASRERAASQFGMQRMLDAYSELLRLQRPPNIPLRSAESGVEFQSSCDAAVPLIRATGTQTSVTPAETGAAQDAGAR
jgi:hypothetical protein